MSHSLQILLLLTIIVASAKLAGAVASRLRQPAVLGEILIGLLLGPTLLNVLGWPVFATPVAHGLDQAPVPLLGLVRDFADVGVILLMFVAGLETDLDEMRRVGKVAFWAAAGGVGLPMAGGALTAWAFGLPLFWEGIFIGSILTATSVSISAQTLMELGAIRSREGTTILGAAVIDDVMGIMVLSVVAALARAEGGFGVGSIAVTLLRATAFFVVGWIAGRTFPAIIRAAGALQVSQAVLAAAVVVAFLYAWAAEYVGGVAAITGSYLAGLLFARTRDKADIDRGIHPLTYSIFVPAFFVSIGLQANARALGAQAAFVVVLVAVAIVGKAAGCGVAARLAGFNNLQSLRVGVGMISRGEVGLIVAGYGLANGLIGRDVFSASVIMVLVTTMVTPPLLKLAFPSAAVREAPLVEETIAGPPEEITKEGKA
ncbi:MAG TPA: cation:proton antiporter [Vicinamibacterales bacterium]|nr:cation:proton antiporter [Vicinamibacterales bacterium]